MIVFAAHVPNSPLLLPSISGDRIGAVTKTRDALEELAELLYVTKPDTIVLVSDHPTMYTDAFSISVSDPYVCDLADVGDLGYAKTYHPDFALIDKLQRDLRALEQSVTLTTDERLNFASAIPLDFLAAQLPHVRIVPLSPCDMTPKEHFVFGQALKHTLHASDKRVAIVSAGDTAHTLTDFAPGGLHDDGATYDAALRTMVEHQNAAGLLQMDEDVIKNAQESAYRKLLVLFGTLDGMRVTPETLSYESPFGVGYLVVNFVLG
ncbi:MAG: class III extradiol dioxygenase subunit B-like domain-containing protein [Patescibacteria group bacterium]